jgi:hypothetical protein
VPFGFIDNGDDEINRIEQVENDKHQQWATWGNDDY